MSALLLFKQAGLDNHVKVGFDINSLLAQAKAGFQGAGETLGRYGRNGLLGAGAGAAGMGLASMMGGEDGESPEEKRSRILSNVLKGTALGGAAGLGGTAFYDQFLGDRLAPNIQAHKDALAKRRPDVQFDPNPRSHNHPYASGLIAATHQPMGVDATVGAAGGMGFNWLKNRSANQAFDKLKGINFDQVPAPGGQSGTVKPDIVQRAMQMAGNATEHDSHMKPKLLEKLVQSTGGRAGVNEITAMADNMGMPPNLAQNQAQTLSRIADAYRGQYAPAAPSGFLSQKFPRVSGLLNNMKADSVNGLARMGVDPFTLKNMKNYGKAGVGGAGLALGGTAALGGLTNAIQKFKYQPEQLRAWNEMGR